MTVDFVDLADRDAWLEARRTGIGGSDVAAICGLDPYRGPVRVYVEKVEGVTDDNSNERMRWGNRLEAVVADEFADQTGYDILPAVGLYRDAEHPFMIATPDRIVATAEPAGLEIKTTDSRFARDWEDNVPERFMLQVQHYMRVVGTDRWFVAVLIGGNTFRYYEVERDDDLIDHMIRVEHDFWQHVVEKKMPAIDDHASTSKALDELYSRVRAGEIDLPDEAGQWLDDYRTAKAAIKELDARADEAASHIKAILGEHDTGRYDGRVAVTWKASSRRNCDFDLLVSKWPDAYEACVSESSSRRLLVKAPKS